MQALLDGDVLIYRTAAVTTEEPLETAIELLQEYTDGVVEKAGCESASFFLTPKGKSTFRYKLCPTYKGNRPAERPKWLPDLREFAKEWYGAEEGNQCEADDLLGINQKDDTVICSIDKDLLIIPGKHYNFVKDEFTTIDNYSGEFHFWCQMLIGDAADNVTGVAGIGKKKAPKKLEGLSPEDMEEEVKMLYDDPVRFIINYNLLRIWQKPWQLYNGKKTVVYSTEEEFNEALKELIEELNSFDEENEEWNWQTDL